MLQGTKLGPLSFLIVFNRILTTIRERFKFVDDLTVLSLRLGPPTTEQSDLIKIYHDPKGELGKIKLTVSETKSSYMTCSLLKGNNHSSHNLRRFKKGAVKIILGQNYSTYEDALKQLNLDSLDSRRHGLTYRFRLNCWNSPTYCRLLPNLESPPTEGPVTRLRQIKGNVHSY